MVDFSKHLKNPPKAPDPSIITGKALARIIPSIKSKEPYTREYTWEIGPYQSHAGEWISFKVTKGGVTGFESFVIRDEEDVQYHVLNRLFAQDPDSDYCACAGGMGHDAMFLCNKDVQDAVRQWLDREKIAHPPAQCRCHLEMCHGKALLEAIEE